MKTIHVFAIPPKDQRKLPGVPQIDDYHQWAIDNIVAIVENIVERNMAVLGPVPDPGKAKAAMEVLREQLRKKAYMRKYHKEHNTPGPGTPPERARFEHLDVV